MHSVAVIILAAGASSRIGRPKALLPWPEEPLIKHHLKTLKKLPVDIFVCSGKHHCEISKELSSNAVSILFHKDWKKGMGASISFSCSELTHYENLLFMAVDQPLISAEHLNKILDTAEHKKDHIIYSSNTEIEFSIPVLFPRSLFPKLVQLSNDKGAKRIVKQSYNKIKIETSSIELSDIDTLEDYNCLLAFADH